NPENEPKNSEKRPSHLSSVLRWMGFGAGEPAPDNPQKRPSHLSVVHTARFKKVPLAVMDLLLPARLRLLVSEDFDKELLQFKAGDAARTVDTGPVPRDWPSKAELEEKASRFQEYLELPKGRDLRLISSVNDVGGIQNGGKNLIIVAANHHVLQFRIRI